MRKVLFLSLAILLICGVAFAATPGSRKSPGAGDIMGQGDLPSDAHKVFRLVRWQPLSSGAVAADLSTLTADSIVIWDLVSDDGVTITTTVTSGDNAVAGIIVQDALTPETIGQTAAQDIGRRNWTWLQTYGLTDAKIATNAGGNCQVGDAFGTSTTPGCISSFAQSTTEGALLTSAGFAYDTAASTTAYTTVEVFLRTE